MQAKYIDQIHPLLCSLSIHWLSPPHPTDSPYFTLIPFFLDLDSTYEREHVTSVFLSLAYFADHGDLHFLPFSCSDVILFFYMDE
jgi:hypothetical protein